MQLFDDFVRTNFNHSDHAEQTYDFYNRVALPEFVKVRGRLEKWFAAYPDEAKAELKRNLQSDFDAAYYELFLYTLFIENGFTVELHPKVTGSTKRPDFLIRKRDFSTYVEARVVHEVTANEANEINLKNRIYDKINEIKSDYFHISIDELVILNMAKAPSLKEISGFVQNALAQVDYQKCLNEIRKNSNRAFGIIPQFTLETLTVKLIISVLPKSTPSIGKNSKLIGIYADRGKAQMINPSKALFKALNEKAKRYGQLENSFIIAINALSPWVSYEEDYTITLFGDETIAFDPNNRVYSSAQGTKGFFMDASGFRYSRVSGILFTKAYHSSVAGSKLTLYHNPGASRPIDLDLLDVDQTYITEGHLKKFKGKHAASLFNLNQEE